MSNTHRLTDLTNLTADMSLEFVVLCSRSIGLLLFGDNNGIGVVKSNVAWRARDSAVEDKRQCERKLCERVATTLLVRCNAIYEL